MESCFEERHTRKEPELLSQILEYKDRAPVRPDTFVCGIWSTARFKKREIHKVFHRLLNLQLVKNLSLSALVK